MNSFDLTNLALQYLSETDGGAIGVARILRALNEANEDVTYTAQGEDASLCSDFASYMFWLTTIGGPYTYVEHELPANFRKVLSVTVSWPTDLEADIDGTTQNDASVASIVPFDEWCHAEQSSAKPLMLFLRHSPSGEAVPTHAYRFDDSTTRITTTNNRYAIGIPYLSTTASGIINNLNGFSVFYAAAPKKLVDTDDTPDVPEEFHHVVAIGAAVRLQLQMGEDPRELQALHDRELEVMVGALAERKGAMVA